MTPFEVTVLPVTLNVGQPPIPWSNCFAFPRQAQLPFDFKEENNNDN